jgi:hypothetical protein
MAEDHKTTQGSKSAFTNDTTIYTIMGVSAVLLLGVGYNIVSSGDESKKQRTEEDAEEDTESDEDTDSDESDEDTE